MFLALLLDFERNEEYIGFANDAFYFYFFSPANTFSCRTRATTILTCVRRRTASSWVLHSTRFPIFPLVSWSVTIDFREIANDWPNCRRFRFGHGRFSCLKRDTSSDVTFKKKFISVENLHTKQYKRRNVLTIQKC